MVKTVNIDEEALVEAADLGPQQAVARIARAKFAAFTRAELGPCRLLTADTLVACAGVVMGKPDSSRHLVNMLHQMSGRSITISTGVCVGALGSSPVSEIVTTNVLIRDLAAPEIEAYVSTGTGTDKAGGLALQAEANRFIQRVDGCWSNVLGLPLCAAAALLGLEPHGLAASQRCSVVLCGDHTR